MAEIESTLDIIMEKAERFTVIDLLLTHPG
jgi:hypothetical protein